MLCLYDVDCTHATKFDFWNAPSVNNATHPLWLNVSQNYDSVMEYECGYGRAFDVPGWTAADGDLPQTVSVRCAGAGAGWVYDAPTAGSLYNTSFDEANMPLCVCTLKV